MGKQIDFNADFQVVVATLDPDTIHHIIKVMDSLDVFYSFKFRHMEPYQEKVHVFTYTCNLKNATAIYEAIQATE